MKLRPRLTIFTVLLVILVVAFTSLTTVLSITYLLRREMKSNQLTLFTNFREAVFDALYLGDDLAIQVFSESLETSVPELAYAIFVDQSRGGIQLGGIESLERFKRLLPRCQRMGNLGPDSNIFLRDLKDESEAWRYYCQEIIYNNVRGQQMKGTVFLGLKLDMIEGELDRTVQRIWETLFWAMVIVLVMGLWMALSLSRRLTKPIHHLTEGAKAIGQGQLETQIPVTTTDELGFLAQEFNYMAEKLKELDKLKDDFVSSVSHELRSPLSAISGYVELLQSRPLQEIPEEKRNKALVIIRESTDRLAQFINDILDLARIEAGHIEIHRNRFKINKLAEDVFGLFQPLLEKKGIRWSIDVPAMVPQVNVDGDKIRQVLTNLISNALKFTPSGGTIRLYAKNQNEFVQISVKDTGIGISEKDRKTVFEKFVQVQKGRETVTGPKGTGLGLAIAKGIVESHGGTIWLESELRKGTTVHFTLPDSP
ncbi:hypothetical protein BVX98_05930 [bacterium F11]|nr:hypothetical protein BVX98_05930 [bacterium F11]